MAVSMMANICKSANVANAAASKEYNAAAAANAANE